MTLEELEMKRYHEVFVFSFFGMTLNVFFIHWNT